jgi:hypothetical protein
MTRRVWCLWLCLIYAGCDAPGESHRAPAARSDVKTLPSDDGAVTKAPRAIATH